MPLASDPPTVIAAFASGEPSRPLFTFYDDATGERTELSRASMANWVAKTANLLVAGLGLQAGDRAVISLPPHWQTAAVLLGCWSAGLCVDLADDATAGAHPSPAVVAFLTAAGVGAVDADDVFALALAPLAAPLRPGPPSGSADYVLAVRGHDDHFTAPSAIRPDQSALCDGRSHADLVAAAAAALPPSGGRVLINADEANDPVTWLVGPLVADASVVLCANLDKARVPARLASERATPYP